jgi:Periplasmic copper-binding protein (NosD)
MLSTLKSVSKVSECGMRPAGATWKWARSAASTLVVSAAILAMSGSVNAASFCVNPAAPPSSGCTATIGAAVAAASANDTINVAAGTYKESVTIGKPLSLIGADATKVIINAAGLSVGIYVDGIDNASLSGVFVSGFTVENANFEGILVTNASAVTISSNIVTKNNNSVVVAAAGNTCPNIPVFETSEGEDCGEGIHLIGVTHSSVVNNTSQGNSGGILISDDTGATHDNTIAGNTVMNNLLACGITLASHPPAALTKATSSLGVYNNIIVGNTVSGNGLNGVGAGAGLFASVPGAATYSNYVINNVLTGNGLPGVTMHSHTPGQTLTNNVVVGNTISGNGADNADATTPGTAGVNVYGVSSIAGTIIAQNTISGEAYDVVVNGPGAVSVQRNSFTGGVGVANLSNGAVNADGNWWGCNDNPTWGISGFAGCAGTFGAVSVNIWAPAAIVK